MSDASAGPGAPPLDRDTRIAASGDQVSADLVDETVVLAMREGVYYSLSGVGSRIWGLAAQPTTLGAIHEILVAEYQVEPGEAWTDLRRSTRQKWRHSEQGWRS